MPDWDAEGAESTGEDDKTRRVQGDLGEDSEPLTITNRGRSVTVVPATPPASAARPPLVGAMRGHRAEVRGPVPSGGRSNRLDPALP